MAPARPERRLLGPQVVDAVLALIDERGFGAGDRLPSESSLAESFGVSRPIVREALRTLSERGVVEVVNGRGAILAELDSRPLSTFFERAVAERVEAMSELMEVRRAIELQAVELAVRRARPEQLAALRATAAAMRSALADAGAYVAFDVRFHLELAEATGNQLIVHLMHSIRPMLERSVDDGFRSRTDPVLIERSHARHEALVAALDRRDALAANELMTAHFDDAVASLRRAAG